MNTKIEDSNILSIESKQGLYSVGEKLYINKLNALAEASKTKQTPTWDFNYSVFDQCCKKPRTNVSLLELYRLRALQLREQYDYLILAFSGGADSDNILQAFINNNIKLDELWTDWPIEMTEKSGYQLNYSLDAKNMPVEFELVVKPVLEKLKQTNPEIKIHFSDSIKINMNQEFSEEQQLKIVSTVAPAPTVLRYGYLHHYIENEVKSKNSCVIIGVDKCIPYASNGVYGFVISDTPTFLKSTTTISGEPCVYEYFYWTPDFPDIVVEQARLVWDYLLANRSFLQKKMDELFSNSSLWLDREKSLDGIIKYITYPKWDFSKIQVGKSGLIKAENHYIFSTFHTEQVVQRGSSILKNMISVLNKDLSFDTRPGSLELKPFYNFHKLGDIKNV